MTEWFWSSFTETRKEIDPIGRLKNKNTAAIIEIVSEHSLQRD